MSENLDQYQDEVLVERFHQRGESDVEEHLMNRYKDMVRKKARALYLIGGETEDLIQEGMIGLFKAVRDYSPERKTTFRTFAGLCVDRQLYKAITRSNTQKNQPLNSYVSLGDEEAMSLRNTWGENPEELIIDRENVRILQEEIRKSLSPMEHRVLELYLEGYGYSRIGELLGKPPKSVDNALRRIRSKVRTCQMCQGEGSTV